MQGLGAGLGFRVWGLGFCVGFRVCGLGFGLVAVWGFGSWGLGVWAWGLGFGALGFRFSLSLRLGFRVWEGRIGFFIAGKLGEGRGGGGVNHDQNIGANEKKLPWSTRHREPGRAMLTGLFCVVSIYDTY